MTQKKFYTILIVVIMLIAGYFSVQLLSEVETECFPHLSSFCEETMDYICGVLYPGGEVTGFWLKQSWCDGETCWGS